MEDIIIYTAVAFIAGFGIAWLIRSAGLIKLKKLQKSTEGFLESERLKKETLRNENVVAHQQKEITKHELTKKLNDAYKVIKEMDSDILLLQQSNEETEALLKAGQPEIHELKLKLIEANNTIARYKASSYK